MKNASSYLPRILGLGLTASLLWAILSMPPGLGQQERLKALLHNGGSMLHIDSHHPGAYTVSWDDFFSPRRQ
jgi:hypothetical protein